MPRLPDGGKALIAPERGKIDQHARANDETAWIRTMVVAANVSRWHDAATENAHARICNAFGKFDTSRIAQ